MTAILHPFQLTRREMLAAGIAAGAATLLPAYASRAIPRNPPLKPAKEGRP